MAQGTMLVEEARGAVKLPIRLDEVVQVGSGLYGFAGAVAYEMDLEGQVRRLAALAEPVRRAEALDERRALLVLGGHYEGRRLLEAGVAVWEPESMSLTPAEAVFRRYNPLRASLGAPRERQWALIMVEKTAVFDPALRLRPFLYVLRGEKLAPLWKGTSFARPFTDAVVANVLAGKAEEMCALEYLPGARRRLGLYHWTGEMAELVGMSAAGNMGSSIRKARWGTQEGLVVFEKRAGSRRAVLWAEGNTRTEEGVCMLQVAATTAWLPREPLAWAVTEGAAGPALVVLEPCGRIRVEPFAMK
ncbi:MAG: hypothetical protein ABFE07_02595 [Armatimonadia bacterium]